MNYKAQKQFRIHYSGDVNIEHGGFFYSFEGWQYDYADFVRCTPCSEADGPDNCFWIERGTINIPKRDSERFTQALGCIGITSEEWADMKPARQRHTLIDACLAYGFYDLDRTDNVQVGRTTNWGRSNAPWNPDTVLRANSSLTRFVRNIALKGF